jgi:hypothetical protein
MHRRLRIAASTRQALLEQDINSYKVALFHFHDCTECVEEEICPEGEKLYEQTQIAAARAKLLANDDPFRKRHEKR